MVNKYNKVKEEEDVVVSNEFQRDKAVAKRDTEETVAAETSTIQKQSFSTDPRPDGGNKVVSEESSDRIKNEVDNFSQIVGKYSACGVCQGAFNRGATVEESKEEFEDQKLFTAVHPECKGGPIQIYVLKREQKKDEPVLPESKRLIEIPAKYIDSVKEEEKKRRKEEQE
jgi:hypothetical protein